VALIGDRIKMRLTHCRLTAMRATTADWQLVIQGLTAASASEQGVGTTCSPTAAMRADMPRWASPTAAHLRCGPTFTTVFRFQQRSHVGSRFLKLSGSTFPWRPCQDHTGSHTASCRLHTGPCTRSVACRAPGRVCTLVIHWALEVLQGKDGSCQPVASAAVRLAA
jgi:hypothetical protein